MSNESVYVAIGIACVVAVLLFIVFIIYCVKRHNDKEQDRQRRQRREREERHRRHLMRGNAVRPPPYDPTRQTLFPADRNIPFTPPPAYKEVATPLPRNGNTIGIGDLPYPPPSYDYSSEHEYIPTVSRNVAPASTYYTGGSYSNNTHVYSNSHSSRTVAANNAINAPLLQIRPGSSASTTLILPPPAYSGSEPQTSNRYNDRGAPGVQVNRHNDRGVSGIQPTQSPTRNNVIAEVQRHSYNISSRQGDRRQNGPTSGMISSSAVRGNTPNDVWSSSARTSAVYIQPSESLPSARSYNSYSYGAPVPNPFRSSVTDALAQDSLRYGNNAHPTSIVEDLSLI